MSQDLAQLRNYVTYDTGGQNRGETTVRAARAGRFGSNP